MSRISKNIGTERGTLFNGSCAYSRVSFIVSPVVPHHQQEKQVADQVKEVMVNNYHFHASLDNVRFH